MHHKACVKVVGGKSDSCWISKVTEPQIRQCLSVLSESGVYHTGYLAIYPTLHMIGYE